MSSPEITVAVPVKDRRDQMLRCLDALLAQDHPDYEILVLDNGSTDGTPEACRERGGERVRVEVVHGPVGRVRNQAAHLARGEFLAFTDSDCLPDPGWLSAMAKALREDPRLGVVQGRTRPETEITQGWPATIQVESWSGFFEGANLAFRREAFARSDGFDEEVGHFWEDVPAGLSVLRNGWTGTFVADALVYHDVTYPGFWWHVKRMQKHANLGPVLRRNPEIRRNNLFLGVFLQPRDARFVALVTGLALGLRYRPALLLALPWLVLRAQAEGRFNPKSHAQAFIYDGARQVGVVRGAIRARRLLL